MKHALCTQLDQTFGYITPDGSVTTRPCEAALFDTPEAARTAMVSDGVDPSEWVEDVPDEAGFRARQPTWESRPFTPKGFFDLVRMVMFAGRNVFTNGSMPGSEDERRQLERAATAVVLKLGHMNEQGEWAFGPAPSPEAPVP